MSVSEEELERILRSQIRYEQPYARADLREVLRGGGFSEDEVESHFRDIRWYAENRGRIGGLEISTFGNKKGRRYVFGSGTTKDPDADSAAANVDGPPPEAARRRYDHPEDRAHIAAHLALLLHRRCAAMSLPKTTGTRPRAVTSTRQNENPDILGVVRRRWDPSPPVSLDPPPWLKGQQRREHLLIAAEVKPEQGVQNASDLYWAMIEARHNTRYFDEGWLLAPIPEFLHAYARALGEEYGIGVLTWRPQQIARADVLWVPTTQARSRDIRDFLARLDSKAAQERVHELGRLRNLADEFDAPIRRWALEHLLTNQLATSMIPRLPASIQGSLRDPKCAYWNEDAAAWVQAVLDVALGHFDLDEVDTESLAEFLRLHVIDPIRRLEHVAGENLAEALVGELRERFGEWTNAIAALDSLSQEGVAKVV